MKIIIYICRWVDGDQDNGEKEVRGLNQKGKRDVDIFIWLKFNEVKDLFQ